MHFETDPVKSPIPELRGISDHRDEQPKSGYLNLGEFLITVMSNIIYGMPGTGRKEQDYERNNKP